MKNKARHKVNTRDKGDINSSMPSQHTDDAAVDRFAVAMKIKLAKARAKGKYGWDAEWMCSDGFLAGELVEHLTKGNVGTFEDIANFAMMLHQRGADPVELREAFNHFVNEAVKIAITLSKQNPAVPEGWRLVPERMIIDKEAIELIQTQCGDGGHQYGEYEDGILWVGELQDDDGKIIHGLHIAAADYPEEGSCTLSEFYYPPPSISADDVG